jgi:dGTP triphosphohydrolase
MSNQKDPELEALQVFAASMLEFKSLEIILKLLKRSNELDGLRNFTANALTTIVNYASPENICSKEGFKELQKAAIATAVLTHVLEVLFTHHLNTPPKRAAFTDQLEVSVQKHLEGMKDENSNKPG